MPPSDKPAYERKPLIPVVVDREDLEVLDWLDDHVSELAKAARTAGEPVRSINRSAIIMAILRRAMEAERLAKGKPPTR